MKITSLISFFVLSISLGPIAIQSHWRNSPLFEIEKEKQNNSFILSKNTTKWSDLITIKQLQLPNKPTDLIEKGQKIITRDTIKKELNNSFKLSLIYYPGNLDCKNCEAIITEIKENGIFTHKYQNVSGGSGIIQGQLNKSNLEYFRNLTLQALVHKYPKTDFINGEKVIRKDVSQFYFLIHSNNKIKKSVFVGTPPNGEKLIEFLLNIAEFEDWERIDTYIFEIKTATNKS